MIYLIGKAAPSREESRRVLGSLFSPLPSTHGTELSAQEFHDALFMRYGIAPPDLPKSCNGCEVQFTLQHAFGCKKGSIVISCNSKI
jgi:hypothetical protein